MIDLARWLFLIVAVERTVELLIDSKIFEPLRHIIKKWAYPDLPPADNLLQHLRVMIDYLFNCGYCMSVWVAAFYALSAPGMFDNVFMNWLISTVFLHGASNMYHVLYEYARRGRINTYDINLSVSMNDPSEDRE